MTARHTRLSLLAVLVSLSSNSRADDPPVKAEKSSFSASVSALNALFKRDADGTQAKKYIGRVATISGKVKAVTATDDGGRTLTLSGLPPTDSDPAGCAMTFPAGHPSIEAVKGLTAGTAVRVRGTLDTATGMAFTLKGPVLLPSAVGQAGGPVGGISPPRKTIPSPASEPEPKPRPQSPLVPEAEPYRAAVQLPAAERKVSAEDLLARLLSDKSGELERRYRGQELEVAGIVRACWTKGMHLVGGETKEYGPGRVGFWFPDDSPALPRVRNLAMGDVVTVRGLFKKKVGSGLHLDGIEVVAGGAPKPAVTPTRQTTADTLYKDMAAGPTVLSKTRGQAVEITGTVHTDPSDIDTDVAGLQLTVQYNGAPVLASVRCSVDEDQFEGVRQLPPGLKVKVVGVIALVEQQDLWLSRCRVSLLEPNPIPTVAVADLVAAYRDDNQAANEKYGSRTAGKWIYLAGEVERISTDKLGLRTASLKGPPTGPRVFVGISRNIPLPGDDQIKVGQKVRVKVECEGAIPDGYTVKLSRATILPEAKTPIPLAK